MVGGVTVRPQVASYPPDMKKVTFRNVTYLGGLPGDKGGYKGNLFADDDALGMGQFSGPKKSLVRWDDMAGISFDSGVAAKSRAGKALLVGVFALAAKNTQKDATVTVNRKDGNVAIYQITGTSGARSVPSCNRSWSRTPCHAQMTGHYPQTLQLPQTTLPSN